MNNLAVSYLKLFFHIRKLNFSNFMKKYPEVYKNVQIFKPEYSNQTREEALKHFHYKIAKLLKHQFNKLALDLGCGKVSKEKPLKDTIKL
jgi:hypothetical protein